MERVGPYLLGGAVSGALIGGIVAAFLSITALVGQTVLPRGSGLLPSGSKTVSVGGVENAAASESEPARVAGPAGPLSPLAPESLHATASASRTARAHVAGGGTGHRNGRRSDGRPRHVAHRGGGPAPGHATGGPSGSANPVPTATPSPLAVTAPLQQQQQTSTPPGLATKPGGSPPGLARKPSGTPPGLASKPGGVPPGQAKKH